MVAEVSAGLKPEELATRLRALQDSIAAACARSGRDPKSVALLAVSKQQPLSAIVTALQLGQTDFGENYAQELRDKIAALSADPTLRHLTGPLRWHFTGPLQRNKIHLIAGRVSLIHSVDSLALIAALRDRLSRAPARPPAQDLLIQVNLAGETQKAGCSESELPALLDAVSAAEGLLRCRGLMCLPPQSPDPEASRPYFRRLRELSGKLQKELRQAEKPHVQLSELSMGMSHDYEIAIAEGATLVRIGTALFGSRHAPA
jgi:pyridoxal phosphate enzyme (YggS family)